MFKERLHKFTGELLDEARRIGTRLREEFADTEADRKRTKSSQPPN